MYSIETKVKEKDARNWLWRKYSFWFPHLLVNSSVSFSLSSMGKKMTKELQICTFDLMKLFSNRTQQLKEINAFNFAWMHWWFFLHFRLYLQPSKTRVCMFSHMVQIYRTKSSAELSHGIARASVLPLYDYLLLRVKKNTSEWLPISIWLKKLARTERFPCRMCHNQNNWKVFKEIGVWDSILCEIFAT